MRKSTCFNQNWLYAAEQISFDSPDEFFDITILIIRNTNLSQPIESALLTNLKLNQYSFFLILMV